MLIKKSKAFITLFTLLFISVFLFIIISNRAIDTNEFTIIKLTDTKKQNVILNIEEIIKGEMKDSEDDPYKVKKKINLSLDNYFKKNKVVSYYILNNLDNKKEPFSLSELEKISNSSSST